MCRQVPDATPQLLGQLQQLTRIGFRAAAAVALAATYVPPLNRRRIEDEPVSPAVLPLAVITDADLVKKEKKPSPVAPSGFDDWFGKPNKGANGGGGGSSRDGKEVHHNFLRRGARDKLMMAQSRNDDGVRAWSSFACCRAILHAHTQVLCVTCQLCVSIERGRSLCLIVVHDDSDRLNLLLVLELTTCCVVGEHCRQRHRVAPAGGTRAHWKAS